MLAIHSQTVAGAVLGAGGGVTQEFVVSQRTLSYGLLIAHRDRMQTDFRVAAAVEAWAFVVVTVSLVLPSRTIEHIIATHFVRQAQFYTDALKIPSVAREDVYFYCKCTVPCQIHGAG